MALCFDTGHAAVGGGDPLDLARTYASRIGHLHLKDVDPVLLGRVRTGEVSLEHAWGNGIFCPLGAGMVDVRGVLALPELQDFEGWIVLEQDRVAVNVDDVDEVRAVEERNLQVVSDTAPELERDPEPSRCLTPQLPLTSRARACQTPTREQPC